MKRLPIDDLVRQIREVLPATGPIREEVESTLRATLSEGLAKVDLVTREEFEVQAAVLARTRAKLEALEARLAQLEGERPAD